MGYMDHISKEEQEFLANYNAGAYARPSVTADIVVFTLDEDDDLCILMIKRGGYPYKGCYALPGGFLEAGKESIDDTARRELMEETGIKDAYLKQLCTFGAPDRDPRTHVISVAYTALIPKGSIRYEAGDDAAEAKLFKIRYDLNGICLKDGNQVIPQSKLAFDHARIIKTAILRLRGRISYEDDAFYLLKDKEAFTISELKRVHECIRNESLDPANFRKVFIRDYLKTGYVLDKNEKLKTDSGKRPAALYQYVKEKEEEV